MKLIIAMSVKQYQEELVGIFQGLEIPVFSKTDIQGYKNHDQPADVTNWFVANRESDFSVMFFAFVADNVANTIMETIKNWDQNNEAKSQMHAYVLNVDQSVN